MSFSGDVKSELTNIMPRSRHCRMAQDAAKELFGGEGVHARCDGLIVQSDCCRRTYIRTAFLEKGTISDPGKGYHLEIACRGNSQAGQLAGLMEKDGIRAKVIERKGHISVYVKEAEQIADMLALMGAHKALLTMENERVIHQMRGNVNRRVNCETANINKTVSAALRQTEAINFIAENADGGLHNLPSQLRETALLRLEYPDDTLPELGKKCSPPVGKSGVNHRLRKIMEFAEKLGF